ncbi:MAG: hypothetical protein AAB551_02890 [Patescibacteria group bacterium]
MADPQKTTVQEALVQIQNWITIGEKEKAKQGLKEILEHESTNAEAKKMLEDLEKTPAPVVTTKPAVTTTPIPAASVAPVAPIVPVAPVTPVAPVPTPTAPVVKPVILPVAPVAAPTPTPAPAPAAPKVTPPPAITPPSQKPAITPVPAPTPAPATPSATTPKPNPMLSAVATATSAINTMPPEQKEKIKKIAILVGSTLVILVAVFYIYSTVFGNSTPAPTATTSQSTTVADPNSDKVKRR